jgi:dolichol-phosphate mannosyltransferase
MKKVSIVIPTYNEAGNIKKIIHSTFNVFKENGIDGEIVVVDDNSPDGTANVAEGLKNKFNVRVIRRTAKMGLASAVVDGFNIANGDILGVIDADLSHNPKFIFDLVNPISRGEADLTIGSRYIKGGRIENWSLLRKLISKGAILLARPLTTIKDPVSGFFFLKKEVIDNVKFRPQGYKICLEIIIKGNYRNAVEIPYTFTNRQVGKSKLSLRTCYSYLFLLLDLYAYSLSKKVFK